ncbi:nucleolin 1-like [Impatiens glandulifera]|uniref:nucleolin 1-like n=1 Tax=Impatiens glandulifera TaxID=253017 RepID=UPI001FB130D2|nr:nucleolin 1-like [Impatiens glandulifera]
MEKRLYSDEESEHEEVTPIPPKPATRKRKVDATLKEASNLKKKLAYESIPARILTPSSATSSPQADTPSPRAPTPSEMIAMQEIVGDDEKVNDGNDGKKDDVMEDNKKKVETDEKVDDDEKMDEDKVENDEKVDDDEKVEDERKDNEEKVDDDEKVEDERKDNDEKVDDDEKVKDERKDNDAKVEDVKMEVEAKVEDGEKLDGVAKVDDVEVDLKLKVKDLKVKLYNTPPKGNYGRRVRKPKKDDSYTNPSLSKMPKTKDPMKVNHLQKFEDEVLDKVKAWLDDPETDNLTTDLHTCQTKKEVLVRVVTRLTWLEDTEIDAFCHLLRKRISCYPKTYKNSHVAIGDCVLSDRIRRQHRAFIKDPAKYPVAEFKDYYMGAPHRYMPEWSTIDDVYMPVNINQKHWILCVARLQKYRIDVYDCDAYIYKNLDPY